MTTVLPWVTLSLALFWIIRFVESQLLCWAPPYGEVLVFRKWGRPLANNQCATETLSPKIHEDMSGLEGRSFGFSWALMCLQSQPTSWLQPPERAWARGIRELKEVSLQTRNRTLTRTWPTTLTPDLWIPASRTVWNKLSFKYTSLWYSCYSSMA